MTPVSLRVRVVEAQIEQVNPTVDFPQAGKSRRSRPAFNNHRHVAPFPVVSCRVSQPGIHDRPPENRYSCRVQAAGNGL